MAENPTKTQQEKNRQSPLTARLVSEMGEAPEKRATDQPVQEYRENKETRPESENGLYGNTKMYSTRPVDEPEMLTSAGMLPQLHDRLTTEEQKEAEKKSSKKSSKKS